jgi:flagellar hook-basal body complex protein FliE
MVPVNSAIAPIAQEAVARDGALSMPRTQQSTVEFSNVLEGMVASANHAARYAQGAAEAFAAGARDDIHGTMIAMSKADIELRLVSNVRNKIIDAFYELWRMQI